MRMPQPVNLHAAGLRRSPRLKEKAEREAKQKKAHVSFATRLTKAISLFTVLCTVSDKLPSMPAHQVRPHATFTDRMMTKFHELNELYDGTLNEMHHFAFSTIDVANNEVFTYHKAMKQPDARLFVEAMQKEISDYEGRKHWDIARRSTVPAGA